MVVAGEIHQVAHANDKAFARRLRGYTIVMPCNVAQVLNTRVHGVPRRDLAAWVKIIFRGTPQTYATKIAAQLNNERARMDYKTLAEQITGLQQTGVLEDLALLSREQCQWDENVHAVQREITAFNDQRAAVNEARQRADTARQWDPSCEVGQDSEAPSAADFGAVMSTVTQAAAQDPDRNLATSFVAMADGVSCTVPTQAQTRESATSVTDDTPPQTPNDGTTVPTTVTDAGSTQLPADTEKLRATVEGTPINEFTHFPEILSQAFPMEFPFGVTADDIGSTGTILKRVLRRLTRVYDGRISHNYVLLLFIANVLYRHAGLRSTNTRVNYDSSEKVVEMLNRPEWRVRAAAVANNPTGPVAKELVKQISPLVRLAGKKVPWSPMERLSASYHIYALYHHFGPPAFFITFAPKTLTNQLMLVFGKMQSPESRINLTLPQHLQHRVRLLTSNTIAQARAYELILNAVLTVLVGIKPASSTRKSHMPRAGLFGIPTAYYGVTECQSRNALHAHFAVWVRTMHPQVLQRIAHDDDLRRVLVNAVDAVVTASTEHFETCVTPAKLICKFKHKPYGIRYVPTATHKGVQVQSVVWNSAAWHFALTPGMKIISFADKNVSNTNSDEVRDIIKSHDGPVNIVFQREGLFDPATGMLLRSNKGDNDVPKTNRTVRQVITREWGSNMSRELNHCMSTGGITNTFFPPWVLQHASHPRSQQDINCSKVRGIASSDVGKVLVPSTPPCGISLRVDTTSTPKLIKSESIDDVDHASIEPADVPPEGDEVRVSPVMETKACTMSSHDDKDPTSGQDASRLNMQSSASAARNNKSDEISSLFWDNILDQNFAPRRLEVGDIFFDGNNGDACDVDDFTLGWVEVVARYKTSVFLSPIYSPRRPFIPKGVNDISDAARKEVIDPGSHVSTATGRRHRLPDHILSKIRDRNCWEWDAILANKAAALHRLRVRGLLVMNAYNVHGFPNGTPQRKHSHRCHKYRDTFRAKWCALGFGRTVFEDTDLRQVVLTSSEGESAGFSQEAYADICVDHLAKPNPPPASGERDERVLYLNLRRKTGTQNTVLRRDVERAVKDVLNDHLKSNTELTECVHKRVMTTLWRDEDETHTYHDEYMCETSAFLAALLGCNTNVSPLGGNVQAVNALFYLTGYLSKNPVKPTSWITCIIAALKSTFRTQSVAEDAGTPSRNAKFFLQKVLNRLNALAEITDTQAAMLVLGHKSFQCSHRFAFCFHDQALEAQVSLHTKIMDRSSTNESHVRSSESGDDLSRSEDGSTGESDPDCSEDGSTGETDPSDSGDLSAEESTSSCVVDPSSRSEDATGASDSSCGEDGSTAESESSFSGDLSAEESTFSCDPSTEGSASNCSEDVSGEKSCLNLSEDVSVEESVSACGPRASGDVEAEPKEKGQTDVQNNVTLPVGGNIIYRNEDGKAFALSQHHHYAHRVRDMTKTLEDRGDGMHTNDLAWWYHHARDNNDPSWRAYQREKGLHDFTLTEYTRHIQVVGMPETLPTTGPVRYYLFASQYPISKSHVQMLRSMHHVVALSGHPPRHPGPAPKGRASQTQETYEKRLLTWNLKATCYGRTMGAILSPWNAQGDCGVHSFEDFEQLQAEWDGKLEELRVDRSWRHYICRDRTLVHTKLVETRPRACMFPDPRPAARRLHSQNLGTNMRVPTKMKNMANKWRYQNSDTFTRPEEYDSIHNDPKMSQEDVENALAIASLLATNCNERCHVLNGMTEQTAAYLEELSSQVERLYKDNGHARQCSPDSQRSGLDLEWYNRRLAHDTNWAKDTLKEIMERTLDAGDDAGESITGKAVSDESLRVGLKPDQLRVLDYAIQCFDSGRPMRAFVHGGPGTGKTHLAKLVMKSAAGRGLTSRFTALSGSAATINGGTTIHYAMGMRKHVQWGAPVSDNTLKNLRHRNRGIKLLLIDEASMTHAQMFNEIKTRLELAGLWEGLHIMVMGDMCQLPPPNAFVKALYADFVLAERKPASYAKKPLVLNGIKIFKTLTKLELTTQNRAQEDVTHTKVINELREGTISDDFLNALIPLRETDVNNGWEFAPILVTSNSEVIMINKRQIIAFAKSHGQYVLKWKNPIRNCSDEAYDIDAVESVIPEAVQYFCVGAPGFVNANKNPVATGIVNGYRVLQHSLIWEEDPWQPPAEGWSPGQVCEVSRYVGRLVEVIVNAYYFVSLSVCLFLLCSRSNQSRAPFALGFRSAPAFLRDSYSRSSGRNKKGKGKGREGGTEEEDKIPSNPTEVGL